VIKIEFKSKVNCIFYRRKICMLHYPKNKCEELCNKYKETNYGETKLILFIMLLVLTFMTYDLLFIK